MPDDPARPRPIKHSPRTAEEIVFSHPSEQELARVLDFYGIEWQYEPVTFPLEWDENMVVTEAFAPDFYLVQEELFVELTTLRPKLMRVKKRKLARLKELYPKVNVRLWSRNDFERFLQRFGMSDKSQELVGKDAVRQ